MAGVVAANGARRSARRAPGRFATSGRRNRGKVSYRGFRTVIGKDAAFDPNPITVRLECGSVLEIVAFVFSIPRDSTQPEAGLQPLTENNSVYGDFRLRHSR
jgi:hypothetical protein